MKSSFFIVDNKSWHPSSFYDNDTELKWVMDYKRFKKIYINKNVERNEKQNIKYAIHKDVYNAFLFRYKLSKRKTQKKYRNKERKTIKKVNNS